MDDLLPSPVGRNFSFCHFKIFKIFLVLFDNEEETRIKERQRHRDKTSPPGIERLKWRNLRHRLEGHEYLLKDTMFEMLQIIK